MKQVIIDMKQNGQLNKIKRKWEKFIKHDCKPLIQKGKPLNIEKLFSLFILPFSGFILAIFILIVELLYNSCMSKSRGCMMEQVQINNKRKEQLILERVKLALIEIGESNNYSIETTQVGQWKLVIKDEAKKITRAQRK